jgi:hypothetical protein
MKAACLAGFALGNSSEPRGVVDKKLKQVRRKFCKICGAPAAQKQKKQNMYTCMHNICIYNIITCHCLPRRHILIHPQNMLF